MKIQFDGHQDYQQDAIQSVTDQSVTDVFAGQPLAQGEYEIRFDANGSELLSELGVGNRLALADEALLANVQTVQSRNELTPSALLDGHNFSIEMETGTGKTYVYLRTLFNKPYLKVLSVTPSKSAVTAKIEIDVQGRIGPARKVVTLNKTGIDLYELSGRRESYRGYIVDDIIVRPGEPGLFARPKARRIIISFPRPSGTRLTVGANISRHSKWITTGPAALTI